MKKTDKIYVAGHRGMVGSAIVRRLVTHGYKNIITTPSSETDLRDQSKVAGFFNKEKPSYVFMAAAKVGGIHANNTFRAEFLYDNLMIQTNIIHNAYLSGVKKLMFLGSSCIYPRLAPQPMKEEYLLSGYLEPTNEPYAIAKIAGIKMCDAYRSQYGCSFVSVMPTSLYGPNDNYHPDNSHVVAALLRKFHAAKVEGHPEVELWGSGKPRREFLHVDDLSAACLFLMFNYDEAGFINIGRGDDITINEFALMIKEIIGYKGKISYNTSKPDGMPQKLLDVRKIHALGWKHKIELREGIKKVYEEKFSADAVVNV